jgi:thioredoxin 1
MCNPWGGALLGALVGMVIAYSSHSWSGGKSKSYEAIDSANSMDQFEKAVLQANRPVLVDFYTDWCGYCRQLAPTIGTLSDEYKGRADFVKVNGDKAPDLVRRYAIEGYPTIMLFSNGQAVNTWTGVRNSSVYRAALDDAIKGFPQAGPPPTSTQSTTSNPNAQ